MKKLIISAILLVSGIASAVEFQGTMVLKGSLKSKVWINGVETTCRAEIKKVKNILEEDSFGNPGYTVRLAVSLSGRDSKKKIEIKSNTEGYLTNFHQENGKVVAKDLNYADTISGLTMEINYEGRLKNVKTNYQGQRITCLF